MTRPSGLSPIIVLTLALFASSTEVSAADLRPIEVPGERAFPESITATRDGTLYLSSLGSGGVMRVKPGASKAEQWIAPGAFDTRSTLGVFADEESNMLWVCSNDASSVGVEGPSQVPGAYLKGFDLATGAGKASAKLPGTKNFCNDMTRGEDGTLYVTDSSTPQILTLSPGTNDLQVWVKYEGFQPEKGAGLDGIAIGGDGNVYVNTFNGGELFRVERKDGKAGAVTKLKTSRPLKLPDGLRAVNGNTFLMVEGSGSLDQVAVDGDKAKIGTVRDGLDEPVSFATVGKIHWVAEGQLSHLFDAKTNGPPKLPFKVVPIAAQ